MLKKLLPFFALLLAMPIRAQDCPTLLAPIADATDVSVGARIEWTAVPEIPNYIILLGVTPGGAEIANQLLGTSTSYQPPTGLPANTEIFVTIILNNPFVETANITCPLGSFTTEMITTVPDCSQLLTPADGEPNASVFTNISWTYATRAESYRVILTDAISGAEIENVVVTGLSFNPTASLPPERTIEVEIIPLNFIGSSTGCSTFEFTTGLAVALPSCSRMLDPFNGEINVALTPTLEWEAVAGATGYKVTITKTPTPTDSQDIVLGGVSFPTNSTPILELEPNTTYFIRIVPFNLAGDAIGCTAIESFSTEIGCGPYFDPLVGDFVTLGPELTLSPVVSICENDLPFSLDAPDPADGYRWYFIGAADRLELISEEPTLEVNRVGRYVYEPYNWEGPNGDVQCANSMEFEVFSSATAVINRILPRVQNGRLELRAEVSGIGDYVFALDDPAGPYQESPVFTDLNPQSHTIYVRDEKGCGIVSATYQVDNSINGFPAFFTPNGDTINETWQFVPPPGDPRVFTIRIFDRYGKLLKEFNSQGDGWDGTHIGRPLPSSDYWFVAIDQNNNVVRGHFALRR